MWLDDLKIAAVADDLPRVEYLLSKLPDDLSADDAICAQNLINEMKSYCQHKMDEISFELEKLRKIRKFSEN